MEELDRSVESLQVVITSSRALLATLDERIARLDSHQYVYDLMALGLTSIGVMVGLTAFFYFRMTKRGAEEEAREAAHAYMSTVDMEQYVHRWLEKNRPELGTEDVLPPSLRAGQEGEDYAGAYDDDDLTDVPDIDPSESGKRPEVS